MEEGFIKTYGFDLHSVSSFMKGLRHAIDLKKVRRMSIGALISYGPIWGVLYCNTGLIHLPLRYHKLISDVSIL